MALLPLQLVRQNCFKITIIALLAVYMPRYVWPAVQNIEGTINDVQTAVDNIVKQITPGEIKGITDTLHVVEADVRNVSAIDGAEHTERRRGGALGRVVPHVAHPLLLAQALGRERNDVLQLGAQHARAPPHLRVRK